ncbi:MAG: LegC family aminotransferase [Pelagibacteraceae bacterium]|nr:LegC family aminotransferase [Pelagibacteraceae bacterium]
MKNIGLHEPYLVGNEVKYLKNCIQANWVSTSGKYLELFEKKIKEITKTKFAIPVLNGTIGLHLSMILSGVGKDEEVIVPTITFVATINAIKYVGANPVFMDTDQYLNIDEDKTIEFIKNNTNKKGKYSINIKTKKKIKALVIVHTFGNAAKFEKLYSLCKKKNIKIIEDAAESLGTFYKFNKFKKKYTGTIGDFGIISFNGNKIVTCGNGGVLLTQNKKYYKQAIHLVNQAKNDNTRFIHDKVGYNYKLSNISAAVGLSQLEKLNIFIKKKKIIRNLYKNKIKKIKNLDMFESPNYSDNNNWLNLVKVDEKKSKKKAIDLIKKINQLNFQLRPVWYPNHLQKPFKKCQRYKINNSIKLFKSCICLPSSSFLKKKQIELIVDSLKRFLK